MDKTALIEEFKQHLADSASSPAHAAVKTLALSVEASSEQTIQGISRELERDANALVEAFTELGQASCRTPLSVIAGCDMFRHHAYKTLSDRDNSDIAASKEKIVKQGLNLAHLRTFSLAKISEVGMRCFRENITILVHGYSFVVLNLLVKASKTFKISVIVTECRPFQEGYKMCKVLAQHDVSVTLIIDSAVAKAIETVDIVIVGAEAVVESGGVINRVGTYGISLIAKAFRKPFYVCSEAIKFVRMFPVSQRDLPRYTYNVLGLLEETECVQGTVGPICDLTPPSHITLLFTDLGILTPSAISDELIQLYS